MKSGKNWIKVVTILTVSFLSNGTTADRASAQVHETESVISFD
jgi:hypothetical protein